MLELLGKLLEAAPAKAILAVAVPPPMPKVLVQAIVVAMSTSPCRI